MATQVLAIEIHVGWALELLWVAIGGGVPNVHDRARWNRHAVHLHIDGGGAEQALHRAFEAQNFFGEEWNVLVGIGRDLLPLRRILHEESNSLGECIGRGLRSAHERVGHHLGVQLVVGECASPLGNHGVHEIGEEGVVGLAAETFEDRLEVVLRGDLLFGRPDRLGFGLHHAEPLHPGIRPGLDLPDVFFGCAHLTTDHDER